jgi:hypothetical protein
MSFLRWTRLVLVVSGLLLASLLPAQLTYPPQRFKNMEAQLTVQVASYTEERGLGAATLTLTVKGPEGLEVEEPHLGDAAAAWKEERLKSTRVVQDNRATWSQVIHLKQSKKGIEALPDVSLRLREGQGAEWEEAKWVDILKRIRDLPGPSMPAEEQPSWQRRWGLALALAAVVLLVLLAWLRRQRRRRHEAPVPPDQWALREIQRIETTLMPPAGEAETFHTQMSFVVRRYLTERFGLHALQQTTAEFLEAIHRVPQATDEQQALLRELFERCDLAKFARASTPPEECRRTADLARELVRQTTKG